MKEGIARLNALSPEEAEAELIICCGSTTWARRMEQLRPFQEISELFEAADRTWWKLSRKDWLEAFSRHPRIGENTAGTAISEGSARWSKEEQSGTAGAAQDVRAELARTNQAYQERFGYIFIVCATGRTGEDMLALLRQRLQNEPASELCVAAEQQRRITRLRLEKLLNR